jgi:hypothetical protein
LFPGLQERVCDTAAAVLRGDVDLLDLITCTMMNPATNPSTMATVVSPTRSAARF